MLHLDSDAFSPFEIVMGTYENVLLGMKIRHLENQVAVENSFKICNHLESLRSLASGQNYLASAGADSMVYLYDMRSRKQFGKLTHHNDTVNHVTFCPGASHLFTCSRDGSIAAFQCGSWEMTKHWSKPHTSLSVNTLAFHPTGKIALSTGADCVVRTWDMVVGKQVHTKSLVSRWKREDAKNVMIVRWSLDGEKFLLAADKKIDVYCMKTCEIEKELTFDSKIVSVEFLEDNVIAIGFESGQIKFCDLKIWQPTLTIKAHDFRVKCLARIDNVLVSASTSGEVKLWRYNQHSLDNLQILNLMYRITCLSLVPYEDTEKWETQNSIESEKINRINKFRLQQEVIIEDEGEQEGTDVAKHKAKASKKNHKKRKALEDTKDNIQILKKKVTKSNETGIPNKKRDRFLEEEDDADIPRKKKKQLKVKDKNISNTKRKKSGTTSEITVPVKKTKKVNKVEQLLLSSIARNKHKQQEKHKLSMTTDVEDAPPKEKRKKVHSLGNKIALKKKRRKDIRIN